VDLLKNGRKNSKFPLTLFYILVHYSPGTLAQHSVACDSSELFGRVFVRQLSHLESTLMENVRKCWF